jgi:nicotinamidase-related amidase
MSSQRSTRRALLVIDVQNEYVSGNLRTEYPPVQASLRNIGLAMDAARAHGIPVVVVQHSSAPTSPIFARGSDGWQLHPVVTGRAHDHFIDKSKPSVFVGTDLAQWIAANQINALSITGYMTQNCVASTVYQAAHDGLSVEVLSDATGAVPYVNGAGSATAEEIHRCFNVVFHSNFAAVLDTADWIAALAAGTPGAKDSVFQSNQRALEAARAGASRP